MKNYVIIKIQEIAEDPNNFSIKKIGITICDTYSYLIKKYARTIIPSIIL